MMEYKLLINYIIMGLYVVNVAYSAFYYFGNDYICDLKKELSRLMEAVE